MHVLTGCRTSLQTSASILASNVSSLTTHIARHAELFNKTVIYPSTNYPGRTQEGPLNALLRKKLEPPIAAWVEEGREAAVNVETSSATEKEQADFSEWVREFIDQRIQKYALEEAGDNYTAEEREQGIETVNTGLRRKSDEDESDEEDEEMEDVMGTAAPVPGPVDKASVKQEHIGLGEIKRYTGEKARTAAASWMFSQTAMATEPNAVRR